MAEFCGSRCPQMALKDTEISALKPREKHYRRADSGGLYLEVFPNGSKLWRWKFRVGGKEKRLALGAYLISGVLENDGKNPDAPILGMQRHLAPRYPMTRAEKTAFERLQTVLDTQWVPLVFAPSSENAPAGQRTE